MRQHKIPRLNGTQATLLGFLAVILLGSGLLALPVSAADGHAVPYMDALFTATTSVCVTGLVTVPTFSTWSDFGQAVILLLIQIGGLGVITILSGVLITLHRRIGLGARMLIQDAFNLNTLSGMVRFVKNVILGTFAVEGAGALLYMLVFVPQYGARGVWMAVFNAVSAFCNAGMDVIGPSSLYAYVSHPLVNAVTCLLIVLGGLGYIVWWDVLRAVRGIKKQGLRSLKTLTLHSKIALSATALLIVLGGAGVWIFEHDNPLTLGALPLGQQLQAALFQSVTTRTAGFATVPQENLRNPTALLSLLLMFIGGSPVGTAGGVKTVTVVVLAASALAAIRNKRDTVLFHRTVPRQAVAKAVAVTGMSFAICFLSTLLLSAAADANALDILYEAVSATATVGLTRGLTPTLSAWGKLIIIVTMYLGRVGPISLAIVFGTRRQSENLIKEPTEEISVG